MKALVREQLIQYLWTNTSLMIDNSVPVEADMSDTVAVELVETDIPEATLDEPLDLKHFIIHAS